jgi:hypothetical protein
MQRLVWNGHSSPIALWCCRQAGKSARSTQPVDHAISKTGSVAPPDAAELKMLVG